MKKSEECIGNIYLKDCNIAISTQKFSSSVAFAECIVRYIEQSRQRRTAFMMRLTERTLLELLIILLIRQDRHVLLAGYPEDL